VVGIGCSFTSSSPLSLRALPTSSIPRGSPPSHRGGGGRRRRKRRKRKRERVLHRLRAMRRSGFRSIILRARRRGVIRGGGRRRNRHGETRLDGGFGSYIRHAKTYHDSNGLFFLCTYCEIVMRCNESLPSSPWPWAGLVRSLTRVNCP
jgi:hypothetical protein